MTPTANVNAHSTCAVPLGSRAFDTLVTLIRHRDRVVEKEDFLREAWRGALVEESNLTKQVSLLRKVLEDTPGSHRYIVTVPGTGYRFGAQVEEREAAQEPLPADPVNLRQQPRGIGARFALFAAIGVVLLGADRRHHRWRQRTKDGFFAEPSLTVHVRQGRTDTQRGRLTD